jgi:4-carboxymuconolactone decarboxylase
MLTAMNRSQELAGHIRGAINNGVTEQEIQEVLLQTLAYCGAPAAMEAFRVADLVIAQVHASKGE